MGHRLHRLPGHRLHRLPGHGLHRFLVALVTTAAVSACLAAPAYTGDEQSGVVPPNQVYKTQFENDWVKLVRVHYGPNAHVAEHAHPETVTAYVYLNASGPVLFKHIRGRRWTATRRPTEPASFRVSRGGDETHEVENTTSAPSDFLRVEFKTDNRGDSSPYARFQPIARPADRNVTKVEFTNRQMRITRLVIAPGQSMEVATTNAEPAVLVALTPATLNVGVMSLGQERWMAVNAHEAIANTGQAPIELLRFDFLTKPM